MCSLWPAHTSLSLLHSHSLPSWVSPQINQSVQTLTLPSAFFLLSSQSCIFWLLPLPRHTHTFAAFVFTKTCTNIVVCSAIAEISGFRFSLLLPQPSPVSLFGVLQPNESYPGSPTFFLTLETLGTALRASSSFPVQQSLCLQTHNQNY